VNLVSLVSSSDERLEKNVLRKQLSQYDKMFCGIPKCTCTCSNNILAATSVVMLFLQEARITILEK
jgi:hypothetical protein